MIINKKIIGILALILIIFATTLTESKTQNNVINGVPTSNGLALNTRSIIGPSVIQSLLFLSLPVNVNAFMVFDPTGILKKGLCRFNITSPDYSFKVMKEWAPGDEGFCSGAVWTPYDELLMCEYSLSNSNIYKINPFTYDIKLIGPSNVSLHAMTYDVFNFTLYAAGGVGGNASNLYTIDEYTGEATLVGPFGEGLQNMIMLACGGQGLMYGIDIETDKIYSINKTIGTATEIAQISLDLNYAQDMCFDYMDDNLYVAGYTTYGGLYACDRETGFLTFVGQFQNGAEIDALAIPYALNMDPPSEPTINGPITGRPHVLYDYIFNSTEPHGHVVRYIIDWGDGKNETTAFNPSGVNVIVSHNWSKVGNYTIKARAQAGYYPFCSRQSTKTITIPRNRAITFDSLLMMILERSPILERILNLR